jgi:ACS family tartrate transporter-like MFS transporter
MPELEPVVVVPENDSATSAIAASALRKASLRLIPLIALGYGAAYVDRTNISFAALQMNRDLHFSDSMYGLGAGLFFISYAACEIPSNLLLYRFGARRWLARIMLTWGLLAIGMMFVRVPWQFLTMRFLLGMAEAGFFPGVVFYLMQWFPAALRARTISRFYIALPLSSTVMGALAGALLNLQGKLSLAGWQWLFLVEGLPPILLGVVFLRLLPDKPADAAWLTQPERDSIAHQLQLDAAAEQATSPGSDKQHSLAATFHSLLDPRVLQLTLIFLLMLTCNYAYIFSAPAIFQKVTSLNVTQVGFLISGIGLLGAAAMLLNARHSDGGNTRKPERTWHVAGPFLLSAAGYVVCGVAHTPVLVVAALTVANVSFYALQGPLWAIPPSFLKGKSAAAGFAAMNTIAILGGFLGPYLMGLSKEQTGTYQPGLTALALPSLVCAGLIFMVSRAARRTT